MRPLRVLRNKEEEWSLPIAVKGRQSRKHKLHNAVASVMEFHLCFHLSFAHHFSFLGEMEILVDTGMHDEFCDFRQRDALPIDFRGRNLYLLPITRVRASIFRSAIAGIYSNVTVTKSKNSWRVNYHALDGVMNSMSCY